MKSIAVVGGGILGIVALQHLIEALPETRVTLIADELFTRNCCSFRKGGFVDPFLAKGDQIADWAATTYRYFADLHGRAPGVMLRTLRVWSRESSPLPKWLLRLPKEARVSEMGKALELGTGGGYRVETFVLDQEHFLPWMLGQCLNGRVEIVRRKVHSIDELGEFSCVVVASGMGAKKLGFEQTIPIRGQWTLLEKDLRATRLGNGVYVSADDSNGILAYAVGGDGWTLVGGTYQVDDHDPKYRHEDAMAYFRRTAEMVPEIEHMRVIQSGVQFRPGGLPPQVHLQDLRSGTRIISLLGPGGAGLSLCAGYAQKVLQVLPQLH